MNNRRNIRRAAAVAAMVTIVGGTLSPGRATAQALSDDWRFGASIYGWMPTIKANATLTGNNTVDADLKFHTILDTLKMTFMGAFDVQKGRWGAFTDLLYLNLGGTATKTRDGTIDGVPVDINAKLGLDLEAWVWTLAGSYRVQAEPGSSLDVLAGARMLELTPTLNYDLTGTAGGGALPEETGTRSITGRHWDGIVGVKGRAGFGDNRQWFIPYYVDVGTGQSQLTWQIAGGVGYVFSWGEAFATWRYLDYRMKSDDKLQDLTINGPLVGVTFRW